MNDRAKRLGKSIAVVGGAWGVLLVFQFVPWNWPIYWGLLAILIVAWCYHSVFRGSSDGK